MNIVWSPEAIEDLASIKSFISEDNPTAAARLILHIIRNIEELLSDTPQIGRAGRMPGTRELVIPKTPFIVPYRLVGETVQVLRVYHGARQWPELL